MPTNPGERVRRQVTLPCATVPWIPVVSRKKSVLVRTSAMHSAAQTTAKAARPMTASCCRSAPPDPVILANRKAKPLTRPRKTALTR